MVRMIVLAGLILSSATLGSTTAGFGQESSTETATARPRHIQKPTLVAPELICLHSVPKAVSRPKSMA